MPRLSLIAAMVLPLTALAQAPVLEVSGANFRPLPLAVARPMEADPAARASASVFDQTLMFDLTASGLFAMLDRKSFLADPREGLTASAIKFERWSNIGAEALIKTQLRTQGANLTAELRLFAVGSGREDLGVSETAPVAEVRQLAHRLANAVYKYFTRETGPFLSRIAFVKKTAASKEVYLADWDGQNAQRVSSGGLNVLPTVSPDGRTVAYTSFARRKPEIYTAAPGAAPRPLVQAVSMATGLAYSPDGKRIAYSLATGDSTQIWVADADGSNARSLTDTPFHINTSPTWSPDGKRIAFVSNRGGSPQLYVMDAAGTGAPRRLTFQGNYNQTPDWSPRGDLIAFTARDERNAFDLFTVNVETGKVTRLTQDQGNNEEPTFSPNGRNILFTSTRNGGSLLFVMTADGNNQQPLPIERGSYSTPDWGP